MGPRPEEGVRGRVQELSPAGRHQPPGQKDPEQLNQNTPEHPAQMRDWLGLHL